MIVVANKSETNTSSSPLSLAPSKDKIGSGISFSELLHGAKQDVKEGAVQNGAFILSLAKDEEVLLPRSSKNSKEDSLLSLLKGEGVQTKEELPLIELNPKATAMLTPAEVKVLISDAKKYLKEKILTLKVLNKAEIDALPKTLKGLAQVATKLGIDVSKITLEEVKAPVVTTKLKAEVKENKDTAEKIKTSTKSHQSTKTTTQNTQQPQDQENVKLQEQVKVDTLKVKENPKEEKATPLFKAQATKEITTEQLVATKATSLELKTPKEKADDTLKLLLRGERVSKSDLSLTADFSVATAKVIAPSATTEVTKNLESLLRGESQENSTHVKLDGLNTPKADSFEVKLNEAKQMTKYLSQDVKNAIEDYKAPFTRVKVQLNPQRLGEIDLTIVQRGKNLHINLSSNNAAINALSMNANDLKLQLSNNGINNATLNFNNASSNQDGPASGQQNHQNRHEAHKEYNYFESEEANEEITTSLEIVVPYYA